MEILLKRSTYNPDLSLTLVTSAILHNILSRIPSNTYFVRVPDNSLIARPCTSCVSPSPFGILSPASFHLLFVSFFPLLWPYHAGLEKLVFFSNRHSCSLQPVWIFSPLVANLGVDVGLESDPARRIDAEDIDDGN